MVLHRPDTPDSWLLAQIRAGSQTAFDALVRRHAKIFYHAAYRVTLSREEAEDIVQEAFLKLWDGRATFDAGKGAKFTTWFYTIVTNLALSRMRKVRPIASDGLPEPADPSLSPEENLMGQERQDAVRTALLELTGPQRMALELFYYSGLSQQDAAKAMNVNLKAYESLLSRAKKQLKEELVLYA